MKWKKWNNQKLEGFFFLSQSQIHGIFLITLPHKFTGLKVSKCNSCGLSPYPNLCYWDNPDVRKVKICRRCFDLSVYGWMKV